jgi:serine/threonine-protein kinase HipA
MAVMGEGRAITRAHVETLGARHGISAKRVSAIIDDVRGALAGWSQIAGGVGVGRSVDAISAVLDTTDQTFN